MNPEQVGSCTVHVVQTTTNHEGEWMVIDWLQGPTALVRWNAGCQTAEEARRAGITAAVEYRLTERQ